MRGPRMCFSEISQLLLGVPSQGEVVAGMADQLQRHVAGPGAAAAKRIRCPRTDA